MQLSVAQKLLLAEKGKYRWSFRSNVPRRSKVMFIHVMRLCEWTYDKDFVIHLNKRCKKHDRVEFRFKTRVKLETFIYEFYAVSCAVEKRLNVVTIKRKR